MQQLTAFVERLAALFDRNEYQTLRTDASVQQDFKALMGYVAAFVTSAVQKHSARNEQTRVLPEAPAADAARHHRTGLSRLRLFRRRGVAAAQPRLKREVDLRESRDLSAAPSSSPRSTAC
jgi:hypothetical protein